MVPKQPVRNVKKASERGCLRLKARVQSNEDGRVPDRI